MRFANEYVTAKRWDNSFIVPTTSAAAGVDLSYSRRHSTLSMVRTQRLLGIKPQRFNDVVSDLLQAEEISKHGLKTN